RSRECSRELLHLRPQPPQVVKVDLFQLFSFSFPSVFVIVIVIRIRLRMRRRERRTAEHPRDPVRSGDVCGFGVVWDRTGKMIKLTDVLHNRPQQLLLVLLLEQSGVVHGAHEFDRFEEGPFALRGAGGAASAAPAARGVEGAPTARTARGIGTRIVAVVVVEAAAAASASASWGIKAAGTPPARSSRGVVSISIPAYRRPDARPAATRRISRASPARRVISPRVISASATPPPRPRRTTSSVYTVRTLLLPILLLRLGIHLHDKVHFRGQIVSRSAATTAAATPRPTATSSASASAPSVCTTVCVSSGHRLGGLHLSRFRFGKCRSEGGKM
ncbi:hypothetical protein K438DRAFT_1883306, partial [Mycena galopus ATCC 62051]